MMYVRLCLLTLVLVAVGCYADNYAVLVAGSNGWGNYRHQADICHAYQVLRHRGFPKDNIITLMYDDLVNNTDNPLKGQIINKPFGPNVYHGVAIDYRSEDLTPKNFLNILSGNEAAMKGIGTGRVLKSGPNDIVFVNFADHGGVGLLCFPNDNLYADDLENTLRSMAKNKQFKKLLFYVEACEAGSMFDNILEEHNNILVSTASAKDESSYAWYCSNPQLDTCLGDLYSITWMEHMDKLLGSEEGNAETLWHQYDIVRTLVNESHVQLYGDFQLGLQTIDVFFQKTSSYSDNFILESQPQPSQYEDMTKGVVSRDAEIHTALLQYQRAPLHLKSTMKLKYEELLLNRAFGDHIMSSIFKIMADGNAARYNILMESKFPLNKQIFPCYKNLVSHFNKICFNTAKNSYFLKYLNKFVNACSLRWLSEYKAIQAMKVACYSKTRTIESIV